MNAKTALCRHLLNGEILNVKNVFHTIGYTNCAREISRMVEQKFNVTVSKERKTGFSRYGQRVTWFDYKLEHNEQNKEGIEKMKNYVIKESQKGL